jgi:hypothetical protein
MITWFVVNTHEYSLCGWVLGTGKNLKSIELVAVKTHTCSQLQRFSISSWIGNIET